METHHFAQKLPYIAKKNLYDDMRCFFKQLSRCSLETFCS